MDASELKDTTLETLVLRDFGDIHHGISLLEKSGASY